MTVNELIALAKRAKGQINRIYLHHTGGLYKQNWIEEKDYHICIEGDGTIRVNGELTDFKEHTWHRNTNAIGIAICCAYRANPISKTEVDWNGYPPLPIQINQMAEVVAILACVLDIPIDKEHIMTHAEAADIDGYGYGSGDPETRWDLLVVDDPGTGQKNCPGGDVIRGLAIWKQNN